MESSRPCPIKCKFSKAGIDFVLGSPHKIRIWDRIARKTPKRRFSDITFEFRIRFCYWRGNICTELLRSLGKCCTVLARVQGYRKKNIYTNKKIQWSWMYLKGIVAWDGFGPILSLFLSYLNRKCSTVTLFCTVQHFSNSLTCRSRIHTPKGSQLWKWWKMKENTSHPQWYPYDDSDKRKRRIRPHGADPLPPSSMCSEDR